MPARNFRRQPVDVQPERITAGPNLTHELVLEAMAGYLGVVRERRWPTAQLNVVVDWPRPADHMGLVSAGITGNTYGRGPGPSAVRGVLKKFWGSPLPSDAVAFAADAVAQASAIAAASDDLRITGARMRVRWSRGTHRQVSVTFSDPRATASQA